MPETDPARAADWRWQDALRHANNAAPAPRRSDALTNRVITFLSNQRQARSSEARARLHEKFPTIGTVHRIRFDPRDGRCDAIEVRLLAGHSPGQIAELSALDPAVVWTYVALFFDIFDRLDAGDFIWTQVIDLHRSDEEGPARERKAMRWLAWTCGPLAADALLLPGRGVGIAEREEDIDDYLVEATQALISRAMALAPLIDRLDHEQVRQITRWRIQARQQREADTGDLGTRRYLENARACLDGIKLSIGRSSIPDGDVKKYFMSHVEPRADEWRDIRRGEVQEIDAKIAATSSIRSRADTRDASAQKDESASDQTGKSQNE